MKHKIVFLSLLFIVFLTCCNKDDDNPNTDPIEQLPPITQTGADTAGCLVNGEVLLPKGNSSGGVASLSCQYQYVDGNYTFGLSIIDKNTNPTKNILVSSFNYTLEEGQTYQLIEFGLGNQFGEYFLRAGFVDTFRTNNNTEGELTITRLDEFNLIISGTFWFDAMNDEGEIVEVREGRFDMHYIP